jgi:two-component system chemotaxis response regulator CheB
MGRDGADQMLRLRQAGARTFGQDEQTSLVYGMPKVAYELGAVEQQLPLKQIASAMLATAKTS